MASSGATSNAPHVVIFPAPIQGPVNCMLKLAELILTLSSPTCLSITFITTSNVSRLLSINTDVPARFARFGHGFQIETVDDGLETNEKPLGANDLGVMMNSLSAQAEADDSRLRELLTRGSCIIGDGTLAFLADVASKIRKPLIFFASLSPCSLWTILSLPRLIQAGELPFQGNDLDAKIISIQGMENYIRRRDLPSFCRNFDPIDLGTQRFLKMGQHYARAQGHILNTFEGLDGSYMSYFHALCPNIYTIGPLHLQFQTRIKQEMLKDATPSSKYSNSFWKEDRNCLAWLDAQPKKSVLYVSIGSLAVMTKDQAMEFWYGIVNSKVSFLWVQRPGSILEVEDIIEKTTNFEAHEELIHGTRDRGYIVNWVPQEEVIAHPAIGGFLTHSGWNSTLESIAVGVPMICWPFFADQQVNSRLVSQVWEIGVEMKDTCDRVVIESMIKEVMETKKVEILGKVEKLSKAARQAVNEDGTSYDSLTRLIDDIKFMRFSDYL